MNSQSRSVVLALVLAISLAILVYLPSIHGEFVWDDQNLLSTELPAFKSLGDALRPPPGLATWTYAYYRPVVVVSHLLDRQWFDNDPPRLHGMNILFHAAATSLIFLLAWALFAAEKGRTCAAGLAAIIFAAHPVHVESVSWLAGRSDVLATVFALAALCAALRWRSTGHARELLATMLAVLMAVLSKETATILLLLVPLVMWLTPAPAAATPARFRPMWPLGAALLGSLVLYIGLRWWAAVAVISIQTFPGGERWLLAIRALGYYLQKGIWPWPQSNIVAWEHAPGPLVSLVFAAVLLVLLERAFRRSRVTANGTADKLPLLILVFFVATLAIPLWNAVGAVSKTPLAERNLYLPSVPVSLGIALFFVRAWGHFQARPIRLALGTCVLVVVVCYGVGTNQRARVWIDDLALWTNATRNAPQASLPWTNLALARLRADDPAGAIEAFSRSLEAGDLSESRRLRALITRALLRVRLGLFDAAESDFRQAASLLPGSAEAQYGLGVVYRSRAREAGAGGVGALDTALAGSHFRTALHLRPGLHPARLLLAENLVRRAEASAADGDTKAAEELREQARAELSVLGAALSPDTRQNDLEVLSRETGVDAVGLFTNLGGTDGARR